MSLLLRHDVSSVGSSSSYGNPVSVVHIGELVPPYSGEHAIWNVIYICGVLLVSDIHLFWKD